MYCWIINVWDVQWIEFKVKVMEYEHTKSTKFHCLVLIKKYIFKTTEMTD